MMLNNKRSKTFHLTQLSKASPGWYRIERKHDAYIGKRCAAHEVEAIRRRVYRGITSSARHTRVEKRGAGSERNSALQKL